MGMTHLGPRDACWLWAYTACGNDPGGSDDVVNSEVVVLQQSLRDVSDLARVRNQQLGYSRAQQEVGKRREGLQSHTNQHLS